MHKLKKLKTTVNIETFNASHLWEPGSITKADGNPYKVFTPYYQRGCLSAPPPRQPIISAKVTPSNDPLKNEVELNQLDLFDENIKWQQKIIKSHQIGEDGAQAKFKSFLSEGISNYGKSRNFPALSGTSGLSAHIKFGEISVNQLYYDVKDSGMPQTEPFSRQLVWREFSYHLLVNFPTLPTENLQKKFDKFPWKQNATFLKAWQKGNTGYPIVDAGMRQLYQTGTIHNRLRMIVGSFLVKNLLIDWREGEDWFWNCLFDANLANNVAGWQWVAGTGADAAPYFRIFNPITQGTKFDANGDYTKKYIPELQELPNKYLFSPWDAPKEVLENANVTLGKNYPFPIVDVKESRLKALDAFASLKNQ